MLTSPSSSVPIFIVGSGNAEYVLELSGSLIPDHKHTVDYFEFFGGSGVNFSLRLLNAGLPAFPLLTIGKDSLGRKIRDKILDQARHAGLCRECLDFLRSDEYFVPGISTPRATILVENQRRTIFSERAGRYGEFRNHLGTCLDLLFNQRLVASRAVMIGHILEDRNPEAPGECTKKIIEMLSDKSLIFANFGNSQIDLGIDFWEDWLRRIHLFQLNLMEMKSLFNQKHPGFSLVKIIHWLKDREITAIMTLDRFGAIGIYKGGPKGIVLAWPSERIRVVDPTGAGDAFGAGLMYMLWDKPDFSFEDFVRAIEEARVWAAYACTHLGGSAQCPDRGTLLKFYDDYFSHDSEAIEILVSSKEVGSILRIFDKI